MPNIVTSSNGSGFSASDLALIKSGQWLPELSHFIPVTSPRNLDDNLNHARDEGEKFLNQKMAKVLKAQSILLIDKHQMIYIQKKLLLYENNLHANVYVIKLIVFLAQCVNTVAHIREGDTGLHLGNVTL